MSWLDNVVPSSSAYLTYHRLVCESCGRSLLSDPGHAKDPIEGPLPQGGGQSDTAWFCAFRRDCKNAIEVVANKWIGCPLGNPLSRAGAADLRESICRTMLAPDKYTRRIGRLLNRIWKDYTASSLVRLPANHTRSPLLHKALTNIWRDEKAEISPIFYTDLEHIYGIATYPTKTLVWRITATDEGGLTNLGVVYLPASEGQDRSVEQIVMEAASENAWD
jgi:hypothetical protein